MEELEVRRPRAVRLSQLVDTKITSKGNGSVLAYDGIKGHWDAKTLSATDVGAASTIHTHAGSDITSVVASATDADTVDGQHAAAFAPVAHTHPDATTSVAGFLSAADKTKLDGLGAGGGGYYAPQSSDLLNVGLTATAVPGCSLTLPDPGTYLCIATVESFKTAGAAGDTFKVYPNVTNQAWISANTTDAVNHHWQTLLWTVTLTASTSVSLYAAAVNSGCTGSVYRTGTSLAALKIA